MNDMKNIQHRMIKGFQSLKQCFSFASARASRGFTLIETFVAITILVTAIAGPLTLAQKGLQSAVLARDQLIASFLSQEGIEFVREHRDNNALSSPRPVDWLQGLAACIDPNTCTVDPFADSVVACNGACQPLNLDQSLGFYNYNQSNPVSPFTRTVRIVRNANGREAKVYSTVSWSTGPFSHPPIILEEDMTNWQ